MGKGTIVLNTIKEALSDLAHGKMVIVVDDENRENEGDFIIPAQVATHKDITFMATHGRGLICAPITKEAATKLELPLMVTTSDHYGTAFTVSVDAKESITTGISSKDRETTIRLLASPTTKPTDFVRPGHIFPLIAKDGGVIQRAGHTEAAVDLAILSGYSPAGVICEILNEDGTCARLPELRVIADKFDLKLISIEDLIKYKKQILISNKGNSYDANIRG